MKTQHVRKVLAVAALSLGIAGATGSAFAGEHGKRGHGGMPPGPPPVEQMVERMQQHLGLGADQSAKVKAILEQERAKHEAARSEAKAAIDKVLTAEQRAKHEQALQRGPHGDDDEEGEDEDAHDHNHGQPRGPK